MKNHHKIVNLVDLDTVLASRERGRLAADLVQRAVDDSARVVISFASVEIATTSFLGELVGRASQLLRKNESLILVVAALNDEVRDSLELVVEHRDMKLAVMDDDQINLLGGSEQLAETLAEAQRLGEFKAAQLADELKVKLPALHQRLSALMEAGAITRAADPQASRGTRHVYRAPKSSSDLLAAAS